MEAPSGYNCLGAVAMRSWTTQPDKNNYCCIKEGYLVPGKLEEVYKDRGTGAWEDLSLWTVVQGADKSGMLGGNFLAVNGYHEPPNGFLLNGNMASKCDLSKEACDVVVTNSNADKSTLLSGFTYKSSLNTVVSNVSPNRGGTAGGTTLTITGNGFLSSGNVVTIDEVECVIQSESMTSIACVTGAHASGRYPVAVTIPGKGYADASLADPFFYIDRWSSPSTWGGASPPAKGEFVLIQDGEIVLIDESTPVLKMLLIKGGHVVFDPDASSEIILRTEYILILDGGSLSIGSEEEPYEGDAVIELHGNVLSTELPVYGAKVLAVRNGTLDIHGMYIPVTWTHLATTASAGDNTIILKQPVTWKAGDQIVIATTEKRFSLNQNEQMTIAYVSSDGLNITLTEPLKYQHISIEQTFAGRTIETRAEVGLLTRNVKIRGDINQDFVEKISACDETFNPGQGAKQSCFNGRYGEEIGTDQFGATVMLTGKFQNQDLVVGRISYTEVTEAGQAFQLGRYALHFHLVGDVKSSYIRGCAVHRTYNRAITIHAANYLTVEKNVVYNNMGHAIFTEDGVEQNNIIQYNLAVFTKTSSSLLNVDITPASYWVVNPNNIIRHNAAAGGSHFGYWYRIESHPSGPSSTGAYCPKNEVMGQFYNNTAHSIGRYGLWVFSMDGMFPKDSTCGGNDLVAQWHDFTVWHCERGAEAVFGGALQFHNMVALDNEIAGLEMVSVSGKYGEDDGPGIFNSLLIGYSGLNPSGGCMNGIIAPKGELFSISNCTFVNYDRTSCSAMSGCSQCKPHAVAVGGVQVKELTFENAEKKLKFQWHHEQLWIDADGSLSGAIENVVLPNSNLLPPQCQKDIAQFSVNSQVPGSVCSQPISFIRFAIDGSHLVKPSSLQGRSLHITNSHGTDDIIYFHKRLTSKEGWAGFLYSGETFKFAFDYSEAIQNISYNARFNHIHKGDYLHIQHDFIQTPDGFGTISGSPRNSSENIPDPYDSAHGDYYWDDADKTMTYIVSPHQWVKIPNDKNGRWYVFSQDLEEAAATTWTNARNFCKKLGADLATAGHIRTPEGDPLLQYYRKKNYVDAYVGAYKVEGSWQWVDGRNLSYDSDLWYPGEPSGDGSCAEVMDDDPNKGLLNDLDCSYKQNFICETSTLVKESYNQSEREVIFEDRSEGIDRNIDFRVWRCYYDGCIPPSPPPPVNSTPVDYLWSDPETWKLVPIGSGGHPNKNTYGLPIEYDSLIIPPGMRLIVDIVTPQLRIVQVYGILTFKDEMDHVFDVTTIFIRGDGVINGKVVAGTKASPFTSNLKILLRGDLNPKNPDNTPMPPIEEISLGWKAIGVFGLLSLHGKDVGKTWVKIGATASAGSTNITLAESIQKNIIFVDTWKNKEVVITATGKEAEETEVRKVKEVSSDGLTLILYEPLNYEHLGKTHTLSDATNTEYTLAGEVGLLTRNIVIEGGNYSDLMKDSFGGRVLVSKMAVGREEFIGKAELTNVEFHNMGQEGYIDDYDPRYTLALHTLGSTSSFVKKCSFNHNFNTAIGLFATDDALIENNVIYHTVSSSIRDDSSGTTFRNNLVSTMLFPGTYQDRLEKINFNWYAGFYLNFASGTIMQGNVVGGSDQIGFASFGELCADATAWSNNEVHSAAFGFMLWKKSRGPNNECRKIKNIYAWRIWDTAIYVQTSASVLVEQVTVADSQLGINSIIFGPAALSHKFYEKTATIKDSLFIGASPSHTCDYDDYVPSLKKQIWGSKLWGGSGGNTAFFIGSFCSGTNMAPKMAFHPSDNYPAIRGSTHLEGVKFTNYKTRSCGKDVAISTNPDSEDAIHPTFTSGITFLDSEETSYIHMYRPKLGSVNPGDCVDMTCDGLKKVIITDTDGSLLGKAGATATAIAEYEWDGDRSHGVGDYRIPISLKTNIDGSKITSTEKFPNKGILRNENCTLYSHWRAWKCTDINHRMMVIESMDADTEVRRLSPIALIANPGPNGYVDLLNGPMDRGWCFGYTCQERISTFYSVVASGTTYEMSLTSTPPQDIRFHLLHADQSEGIVIRLFFPKTQRFDVYVDGIYVSPKNIDRNKDSYQLLPEDDSFIPTSGDAVGSNYLQRSFKLFHFVVKGGHVIDVKTMPVIVLSTGFVVKEDNFFEEEKVVEYLALLLGISVGNIRVLNVIREDSSRRRSETAEVISVETEVASVPSPTLKELHSGSRNITGDELSYEDLKHAEANMVTKFQTGAAGSFGNYTLADVEIEDPILPPPAEAPPKATKESGSIIVENGELFSDIQQKKEEVKIQQTKKKSYQKPGSLSVNEHVGKRQIIFVPFPNSTVIGALDTKGVAMVNLGHPSDPWRLTAHLIGGPEGSKLLGDTEIPFVNGIVNYSNIAVSKPWENYSLMFNLSYPENGPNFTIGMGSTFRAADRSLKLIIPKVEHPITALQKFSFGPFIIWDNDFNAPVDPSILTDQIMEGQISIVRGSGLMEFNRNSDEFTVRGENITNFTAKGLILSNRPHADVRFAVTASILPAGWELSDQHKQGEGFVLLRKDVFIPDDSTTSIFTMRLEVGTRWGKIWFMRGKEHEINLRCAQWDYIGTFGKKVKKVEHNVHKYLLKKIGRAYYKDVDLNLLKHKASVNITVIGSRLQLHSAESKICKKMKQNNLRVGIFKFRHLSVDGKYKWCN